MGNEENNSNKSINSKKSIFLIGETRTGKSTLGNFLLGRNCFRSGNSIYSITTNLQKENINSSFCVIDTPGIYDSKNKDEENFKEALNTIEKDPNKFNISLVLIVISLANPTFDINLQKMIKFVCKIFPKSLGNHTGIVFTNNNKNFENKRQLAEELSSAIMKLISNCTNEPEINEPKLFFVESIRRDKYSINQKNKIIKLASELPIINEINTRARPISPERVIIREIKTYEEKKENQMSSCNEGRDFFDSLDSLANSIGKFKAGYEYAKAKNNYRRGNTNSFLDFSQGCSFYDDAMNKSLDERRFEKSFKGEDDCHIF